MPTAICNTCEELIPLKGSDHFKNMVCSCGSKDLSAVAGKWNEEKSGWDYFNRKGDLKKFVEVKIPNPYFH